MMIRDLFKDLAGYLPSYIVSVVVGIVTIPIITRLFPPEHYGNYVLVLAAVSILSTIATAWLCASIIRFYPAYKLDNRVEEFHSTIIKLTVISVAAISTVTLSILYIVRGRVSSSFYYLMLVGLLVFILTSVFNVFLSDLRAKRQVAWYSSFTIWRSVTGLGLGVAIVIAFHRGVEGLLWGSFLSIAIILPLLWRIAIGKLSFQKGGIHSSMTSEMVKYGLPVILINLASWIMMLSDRYVLGFFRGSGEVGIYSAGYAIPQRSILTVVLLLALASGPIAVNIWERQGVEASQIFLTKLTRYYLLIGLPATVGLSVLSKPVMRILTTPAYFPGYRVIPLVAFGIFLLGINGKFGTVLSYYKKTNLIMFCNLISAALNLGLNFLFIPKYGYIAAAATTFIAFAADLSIKIAMSRQFLVWQFPFKSLGKIAVASAVMSIIAYPLGNSLTASNTMNLMVGICIGAVVYSVMLLLLRELRPEEIREAGALAFRILKLR